MSETNSTSEATILIVAVEASGLRDEVRGVPVLKELGVKQLSSNLQGFLSQLDKVLNNLNDRVGNFEVDEMEVYAEISAEGKVSLMGTGVQAGTTGGVKLILRRSSKSK